MRSTGKPSLAKIRRRLARIHESAEQAAELSRHWNPKGRNFKIQRDMIRFFDEVRTGTSAYLEVLNRR